MDGNLEAMGLAGFVDGDGVRLTLDWNQELLVDLILSDWIDNKRSMIPV